MKTIEKFLEKVYENLLPVRMTLRKYKHLLKEMMSETDDEETADKDGKDDDDDPESEEEEIFPININVFPVYSFRFRKLKRKHVVEGIFT